MKRFIFCLVVLIPIISQGQNIQKGYHGFVDAGYCYYISQLDPSTIEITTSHGYQFNHYIFLGAGVGFDFTGESKWGDVGNRPYNKRDSKVDIPVFFNARANITKTRIVPFVDGKIGAYVNNEGGIFVNASLGARYAIADNMGLSLSVGYEIRKVTVEQLHMTSGKNYIPEYYYTDSPNQPVDGLVFKVGFDF